MLLLEPAILKQLNGKSENIEIHLSSSFQARYLISQMLWFLQIDIQRGSGALKRKNLVGMPLAKEGWRTDGKSESFCVMKGVRGR